MAAKGGIRRPGVLPSGGRPSSIRRMVLRGLSLLSAVLCDSDGRPPIVDIGAPAAWHEAHAALNRIAPACRLAGSGGDSPFTGGGAGSCVCNDLMLGATACTSDSEAWASERVTGNIGPAAAPCSLARPERR